MARDFEFTAGTLALNLVDTVARRGAAAEDLLAAPADLSRWLNLAGFDQNVLVDPHKLDQARQVREAAFQLVASVVDGRELPQIAADTLNSWAACKDFRPQFKDGEVIRVADNPFEAALSQISADALLLLDANKTDRLRRCPECAMLFFDQSRPGNRLWCSSSSGCGNRAKVRRHRERKRLEARG